MAQDDAPGTYVDVVGETPEHVNVVSPMELDLNITNYRDTGKVLCTPKCCGRKRNITTTKAIWGLKVAILSCILVFHLTLVVIAIEKYGIVSKEAFGAFFNLLTALVGMLIGKPQFGKTGIPKA